MPPNQGKQKCWYPNTGSRTPFTPIPPRKKRDAPDVVTQANTVPPFRMGTARLKHPPTHSLARDLLVGLRDAARTETPAQSSVQCRAWTTSSLVSSTGL